MLTLGACARVAVVVLCVCICVSVTTLTATYFICESKMRLYKVPYSVPNICVVPRGAYTVCMFLIIGACMRVRYSSCVWSEAEVLANVAKSSIFNEIHTMLTLKMPYEV